MLYEKVFAGKTIIEERHSIIHIVSYSGCFIVADSEWLHNVYDSNSIVYNADWILS